MKNKTKNIARIGVLAGIATVIMLLEFPLWFAPSFYKLDFSEVAVLIGGFAIGPLAAVIIEFVKILLNFVFNGTITGGVGEAANFIIGCAFVVPASIIYHKNKSVKNAIIGLLVGIISLAVVGGIANYYVLLPVYAKVYGAPIQYFIDIGTAINSSITDLKTFVFYAVVPFNLFKGITVSILTMLIYKRVSPIFKK